ncbi:hypothetical protein BX265_7616 [Streptomyces sp. TLI_235]|nr:hypothetical protein [Streptomyces sp. TLI_235]PBC70220.1 hypothetical protein BX265_7616 [Streptomyces sp. TLI_235]
MAHLYRTDQTDIAKVEVFDIELSEEELSDLRAAPEKFLRDLFEREGHEVNSLVLDTRLGNGECGCGVRLVHSRADDWTRSSHYVQCVLCK